MTNGNAAFQKIFSGVAVMVAGAVMLGWAAIAGDVRVNRSGITAQRDRIENCERLSEKQSNDLSEIKADIRAIKVILEQMDRKLEEKRR